jgi:hypothetical protein
MSDPLHNEHKAGAEPVIAPVEKVEECTPELASDMEVALLTGQINTMNAAALKLENECTQMMLETGGEAGNSSEHATALQAARDMRNAACGAASALANAATDPKTGKKMISSQKVTSLVGGMLNFISGAEAEGAKIEATKAETQAHEEEVHAKSSGKGAKKIEIVTKCSHALVHVEPVHARPHGWAHMAFAQATDFGARIKSGFTHGLSGITAWGSMAYTDIIAGPLSGLGQEAVAVYGDVKDHVIAGVHSISAGAHHAVAALKEKWHAGKVMVAEGVDRLSHLFTESRR